MGFLSGIGKIFNDVTGVSNSAKINNQYQKEFAQNGHQWEMQDLKKAGLNPALTATGGSGASAGGAGGTAGNMDASTLMATMANIYNNTRATSANNNNLDAQAELARAQAIKEIEMLPFSKDEKLAAIQNLNTSSQYNMSNAKFTDRRASGKGWNAGAYGVKAGYNY